MYKNHKRCTKIIKNLASSKGKKGSQKVSESKNYRILDVRALKIYLSIQPIELINSLFSSNKVFSVLDDKRITQKTLLFNLLIKSFFIFYSNNFIRIRFCF